MFEEKYFTQATVCWKCLSLKLVCIVNIGVALGRVGVCAIVTLLFVTGCVVADNLFVWDDRCISVKIC